jgi:flagellar basal-body rod protein FlgB
METNRTELISAIADKMEWLAERQKLLAQNIAHADMPNFKPKDLAPYNFKNTLQQVLVTPTVTQAHHIMAGHKAKPGIEVIQAQSFESLPSGSVVDLEAEMMKVSQSGMDYAAMASLMKKWQGMIRIALGR